MSEKTWDKIEMLCDSIMILCGILGFAMNLIHIDFLITQHFVWFVIMNVVYAIVIVLGWKDLSRYGEEDS